MLVNIIQNTISSFRSALAAAEVITTNLKMWLGFETSSIDGDNQITPDKSGNNNVGELFTGKALDFNGSTDYVDVDGFQMAGTNATFAFWFNSNDTLGRFFDIITGSNNRFILSFNNNQISILDDTVSWFNFGSVTTNVWNRCVITINGTTAKCFVNGVQLGKYKTISTIDFSSSTDAAIGSMVFGTQSYFDGSLSDFQIYNSAWSTDDIAFDYANPNILVTDSTNTGTSIEVTNLKAYWAMSEGAGSVAYDSSGEGNNGTINGATYEPAQPRIPQLGMQNWSKGSNLLTYSNDFTEWLNPSSIAITPNYGTSPIGTQDASRVVFTGSSQLLRLSFTTTTNLTASIYMKGSGTIKFGMNTGEEVQTLSTNWQRFIVSRTAGATSITFNTYGGTTARDIQVWGAQVEVGTSAGNYRLTDGGGTLNSTVIPNPTIPTKDILGNLVRDRLNSFNLDGSGYAEVADEDSINPTTEITVQCWIQSNTETNRGLVAKWDSSVKDYMLLKSGTIFRFYIGTDFLESNTIPTSGWVNIAGTYDGSNIKTYINGVLSTTTARTGSIPNSSNTLDIGRYNSELGIPYSERISDVLLYDTALDANEIKNNYNAGLSAHTND